MIGNMVEYCRNIIPGLDRTNFRAGEDISFQVRPDAPADKLVVEQDGMQLGEYSPPEIVLRDLKPGKYFVRAGDRLAERFNVNLFAHSESDLTACNTNAPDMGLLDTTRRKATEADRGIYYLALLLVLIIIGATWKSQEYSD